VLACTVFLSNIAKIMETIMARRIAKAALQCRALESTQFGAIKNRSAIDALCAILHPASLWLLQPNKKGYQRKPRPTLLANDIQRAFKNTDPHRLVKIMEARKLPTYLTTWTRASFTANRTMSFCFDNLSETPQPYLSGLPQGSPAAPVLFLIYAQAMLEAPELDMADNISYLDDDGLLQGHPATATTCKQLQDRMTLRIQRGAILNHPYDVQKLGLIHFTPQKSHENPSSNNSLSVTITNTTSIPPTTTTITPSTVIKHLGVQIDAHLTFVHHADYTCSLALQTLGALSRLRHRNRRITFPVARNLITSALLPQLLWASPASPMGYTFGIIYDRA
jgi:hypothetical protein